MQRLPNLGTRVLSRFPVSRLLASNLYAAVDKNGDGKLTLDEFEAMGGESAARDFDQMDTNGDGSISRPEIQTFFDMMQQSMGGMGGMGGGMGGGGPPPNMQDTDESQYDDDVVDDPDDVGEEDDDAPLPAHDEL